MTSLAVTAIDMLRSVARCVAKRPMVAAWTEAAGVLPRDRGELLCSKAEVSTRPGAILAIDEVGRKYCTFER